MTDPKDKTPDNAPVNFIRQIINEDLAAGKNNGRVATRFPPEPNGYLHIGHAKSICLNFGLALDYQGTCNLRFDDTNPVKEDVEYVDSIMDCVHWLGFDWQDRLYYASDYFEQLYNYALELIAQGKAYVDDLTADEIRQYRGTLTEPGQDSPYRNRTAEENRELFQKMRAGAFADGSKVLRAKIDMHSPNLNMRDPVLYRIRRAHHHRTGSQWLIYPMYDYAHALSDALENITHSICTLEFEDHRPLYDWIIDTLKPPARPRQYEFARLNLTYTLMSKRRLREMVETKVVDGWDDPRMPTLVGLRRRGYTPEAIRAFCERIGVAKKDSWIDMEWLEQAIRDDLNTKVPRVMGVLNPLKVVITNYPEGQSETLSAPNFPDEPGRMGWREIPFGREIYIDRQDFMEDPPKKFFRLSPGKEVRLRWAYFITCQEVLKDRQGKITELRCTYDPASKGGDSPDGRKVKGTIHWVSAAHCLKAKVRLYDRLFNTPKPQSLDDINPLSLEAREDACLEPILAEAQPGQRFQFERVGFFYIDPQESEPSKPVFNRIATLKDTWAKIAQTAS